MNGLITLRELLGPAWEVSTNSTVKPTLADNTRQPPRDYFVNERLTECNGVMNVFAPTDWPLSEAFARSLLEYQCPDLADLPIEHYRSSWDNELYRLGDYLLIRLPKHEYCVSLIENENRWLPTMSEHLTTYTPRPVFAGVPCEDFPWPWSVVPFFSSLRATGLSAAQRGLAASSLVDFFASLHITAPADAPTNTTRGVPIGSSHLAARFRAYLTARHSNNDALAERWAAWTSVPEWDRAAVWVHGDIQPNSLLLTEDGDLSGVIDWGNITSGDPACDIAGIWLTFDAAGRDEFVSRACAVGMYDAHIWTRAKAWALLLALGNLHHAQDFGSLRETGESTLEALLAEPADPAPPAQ